MAVRNFPRTISAFLLMGFALVFFGSGQVVNFVPGSAEDVAHQQEAARQCIDAGECDPLDPTPYGVVVPDGEEAPEGAVIPPKNGAPNPEFDSVDAPTKDPLLFDSSPEEGLDSNSSNEDYSDGSPVEDCSIDRGDLSLPSSNEYGKEC